jgi:hypothetical protein
MELTGPGTRRQKGRSNYFFLSACVTGRERKERKERKIGVTGELWTDPIGQKGRGA